MPLHDGRLFEGVELVLHDGAEVVGCTLAAPAMDDDVVVYVALDVYPRRYARAAVREIRRFALAEAPVDTYRVTHQKTGSINSHGTADASTHRRHVIAAEPQRARAALLVINGDPAALDAFVATYVDVARDGEVCRDEAGNTFAPITTAGHLVHETIFAASVHGLPCLSTARRQPTILFDTLWRSKHTYAQQTKHLQPHELGPTRDLWRFYLDHLPWSWWHGRLAPFTWEAYARCVFADLSAADVTARVPLLPQPMRSFVVAEGRKMTSETHAMRGRYALALATTTEACRAAYARACAERSEALVVAAARDRFGAMGECCRWAFDTRVLVDECTTGETARAVRAAWDAWSNARAAEREWARTVRDAARKREALAAFTEDAVVASSRLCVLTEAQQAQGLHLFHCLKYGDAFFDERVVLASRAALLQFAMHGWWVHLVTVYERTRRFVGFGDTLRGNVDETTMPAQVRNRCRKVNGALVGAGGPGCKGIVYAPRAGHAVYNPKRQQKRTLSDNVEMGTKRMRHNGIN